MERITPSDPFGSKDDPFGDSFTSYTVKRLQKWNIFGILGRKPLMRYLQYKKIIISFEI